MIFSLVLKYFRFADCRSQLVTQRVLNFVGYSHPDIYKTCSPLNFLLKKVNTENAYIQFALINKDVYVFWKITD